MNKLNRRFEVFMSSATIESNSSTRFTFTYTVHSEVHGDLEHVRLPFRSFLPPHFFIAWQTSGIGLSFVQCTDNVPSDHSFQPHLFGFGTATCAISECRQMFPAWYAEWSTCWNKAAQVDVVASYSRFFWVNNVRLTASTLDSEL